MIFPIVYILYRSTNFECKKIKNIVVFSFLMIDIYWMNTNITTLMSSHTHFRFCTGDETKFD